MAFTAMARFSHSPRLAALLLLASPAAVFAQQDEGAPADPVPQPTSGSPSVETLEGVPEGFSLPPRRAPTGNRFEPMVQPLPQPSPTPSATSSRPAIRLPDMERPQTEGEAVAVPRVPAPAPVRPAPADESRTDRSASAPDAEGAAAPPADPGAASRPAESPALAAPGQGTRPLAGPSGSTVEASEAAVREDSATGFGLMFWILGGVLLAALAIGTFLWLRRRSTPAFVVEKIEPYRVPPAEAAGSQPGDQRATTKQDKGFAEADGATAAASPPNGGGFVTSRLTAGSARPQQAATPAPKPSPNPSPRAAPAQKRFVTPDGRIVTTLSPSRGGS